MTLCSRSMRESRSSGVGRLGPRTSKFRLTKSHAGRVDAAKNFSRRCAQPVNGCAARAGHHDRYRALAPRNGYAQDCVGRWCRQLPVGAPVAHCKRSRRPSAATCATHLGDRTIAEPGCWFIRCSRRTFPPEAAAVRLGQLESEERL